MWRFKVSKFKNAAPKQLKKHEYCTDLPVGNLMNSSGNYVAASCKFVAFNVEFGGTGKAAVLHLDETGRKHGSMPVIFAHSDFVSDMAFSPFHDDLLFTGSFDGSVKMWKIPEAGLQESLSTPLSTIPSFERRIENIACHPAADNVIAVSVDDCVYIYDVGNGMEKKLSISTGSGKPLQSMDWKPDGSVMITSSKDKELRVFDPRGSSVSLQTHGHDGIKDSRSKWIGNSDFVFSTGFGMARDRVLGLWDTRNFSKPVTVQSLDNSNGTLMPFFDPDTNMLFLAGKGDTTVSFFEFTTSDPYFTLSYQNALDFQTIGMGIVPKRAMDVMTGEVNRLMQLSKQALYPLKYIVPRKSYKDFIPELFPDTTSGEPSMTSTEWFSGQNKEMAKVSLDPSKKKNNAVSTKTIPEVKKEPTEKIEQKETKKDPTPAPEVIKKVEKKPEPQVKVETVPEKPPPSATPEYTFTGVTVAKFKHLVAEKYHKNNNIENLRNLAESLAGESDGFQAYKDLVAVPLAGPGGQIAVFQISKPGRLPETGIPVLMNGSSLLDFVMDPFNNSIIAAGCEDGVIRIWQVPEEGLSETLEEPAETLRGHTSKVNVVRYHPTASNLLTSASYDFTIRLWNIGNGKEVLQFPVPDQVLSMAWSPDGVQLAVFTKDSYIRIYNPREGPEPLKECPGPSGIRGGRVLWGGPENQWIIMSGFSRASQRCIFLYDTANFKEPLETQDVDVSPSVLVLHYDEDSSTLFGTGKGDSTVYAFEIRKEEPHIFELSPCKMFDLHQGMAFLRKDLCNVREVEFAKAARLTKSSIEQVGFTVPRIRKEFFQDDLFPETRVKWEPALSCKEWVKGRNEIQPKLDLRPSDMTSLSKAPAEAPKAKKYESQKEIDAYKSTEQKKEELINSMIDKLGNVDDEPLYQDSVEGVDEDEWDD